MYGISANYFGGAIVNRTYGTHKHLYIFLFLVTIFGPISYGPPSSLWSCPLPASDFVPERHLSISRSLARSGKKLAPPGHYERRGDHLVFRLALTVFSPTVKEDATTRVSL